MSRRAQENVLTAVVLCVFVVYIAIAAGFGPNARLVPLPIASLGLVCLLAQLVRQNRRGGLDRNTFGPLALLTGGRPTAETKTDEAVEKPGHTTNREVRAFGFVGAFVALIVALGPVPAVFVFCAGFLAISKHYPLWKALAAAGTFAAAVYLLFVVGLGLQNYHGLLAPFVDRF